VIDTDVDHVQPRRQDAGAEGFLEGPRGVAVVPAERDGAAALLPDERAVGAADQPEDLGRHVQAHLAPHVVGPEHERVDVHAAVGLS
jgi:hypothetical protein